MFRCEELPPAPAPPAPTPLDNVVSFDELLTSSIQSEEAASAFDPIPGSVPEENAPGTEPNRVQESVQLEQSEHVA
eukprot:12335999-Karenia_brevis.AAC.1